MKIVEYFVGWNCHINIATNGSTKTETWWTKLAELLKDSAHNVTWGIDGSDQLSEVYRKGSNYSYTEIKDHDFSKETPMTLNTGDLLLFHSFLMHKSYDNNSQARRTAMVYHFAETGTDFGPVDSPTNEWISVRGKGLNA